MKNSTIVLASGGTGGHIFPAKALAEELNNRGYTPVIITDHRYDKYSGDEKWAVHTISSSSIGGGFLKNIKGAASLIKGYFQARKLLKKLCPAVVIGFGGYPSVPTVYAASRMKIKTIIHEQNSMLGRANFVLAGRVDLIATSFEDTSGIMEEELHKIRLTGNPVRNGVKAVQNMNYPDLAESGILRILVTGGSQGASVFSKVVPEAIAQLSPNLRERIRVDQQCRESCIDDTKAAYKKMGISADLATFFNDIPSRLASSHLVISRSGASTLAEIAVAGRPVIMVPYPHALDDHQRVNANTLEESGGGWVIPQEIFTAQTLAARLEAFLRLPSTLIEAAEKSRNISRPDADKYLANLVDELTNDIQKAPLDTQDVDTQDVENIEVDVQGLSKLDKMETKG